MGFAMVPPKLKFSLGAIAAALNVYVRLCNFKTFRMRCATFRRQGAERPKGRHDMSGLWT